MEIEDKQLIAVPHDPFRGSAFEAEIDNTNGFKGYCTGFHSLQIGYRLI